MILSFSGTGVSEGIAVGRVHLLSTGELELPEYHLEPGDVADEVRRLHDAAQACENSLREMEKGLNESSSGPAGELLQAHRMMVRDDMLIGEAARRIEAERINAEWALDQQAAAMRREFERIEDDYLSMRVEDLDQVVRLVQRELADLPLGLLDERAPARLDQTVVLARELSPADLALLHQRRVAGVVTEHGAVWSHSAILARAFGIPMVVAVHRAHRLMRESEPVILDSHYGVVLATDDEGLHSHYIEKSAVVQDNRRRLRRYLSQPDQTRDGQRFRLFCNAEQVEELERCRSSGAVGVGLMRTEFLFARPGMDDEESQYQTFRRALEVLDGRPLTIRTLDAGGDKLPESLRRLRGPNPALGLRGLRMSLAMREQFEAQVRAMLRASCHGQVRILLPMLTQPSEAREARSIIAGCRDQLLGIGINPDPDLEVGGMIETPAAALTASLFASELDFLSIGTNDLVQYVLAVDRQDELVSHLFDPGHRAVVTMLAEIVEGGRRAGRPVQVCGEMAGDPRYLPLLIGLGLTEFSMPPSGLAGAKAVLTRIRADRCRERVGQFLADPGEESAQGMLDELAPGRV